MSAEDYFEPYLACTVVAESTAPLSDAAGAAGTQPPVQPAAAQSAGCDGSEPMIARCNPRWFVAAALLLAVSLALGCIRAGRGR